MSKFGTNKHYQCSRLALVFALLFQVASAPAALACMAVPPPGAQIEIAQETAVIVWDAATHTEHFIRNATFSSNAKDFGFLVPTPSVPTLAIVDNLLFYNLDRLLLPKHERRTKTIYDFNPLLIGRRPMTGAAVPNVAQAAGGVTSFHYGVKPASAVRVLASQQLGTYDTAVLEADNALALNHWLAEHGYASRPSLTTWLEPYIAAHWKITAFKITSSEAAYEQALIRQQVEMPPIRMSFQTDHPFYPYREPAREQDASLTNEKTRITPLADFNEEPASRLLRIYLLGSERMKGEFGGTGQALSWPGRVTWTNHLTAQERDSLTTGINTQPDSSADDAIVPSTSGVKLPVDSRLTVFEDRSSPRPGIADVFFERSNDQRAITPPPIIDYDTHVIAIPADLIALMLFGVVGMSVFAWRVHASRRAHRQKRFV